MSYQLIDRTEGYFSRESLMGISQKDENKEVIIVDGFIKNLISSLKIVAVDEVFSRSVLRLRCNLLPSSYHLDIRRRIGLGKRPPG